MQISPGHLEYVLLYLVKNYWVSFPRLSFQQTCMIYNLPKKYFGAFKSFVNLCNKRFFIRKNEKKNCNMIYILTSIGICTFKSHLQRKIPDKVALSICIPFAHLGDSLFQTLQNNAEMSLYNLSQSCSPNMSASDILIFIMSQIEMENITTHFVSFWSIKAKFHTLQL